MTTRAVEAMREWDTARYGGGFDGLHDLADREFTGAVEADSAVCFMLRGRVVGVFEMDEEADHGLRPGDIDAFEGAAGTAYEAPHAALPLLFTMQATGGEERGRYYTEDTPIEEVHERLSGGFTGYLELSENVLSGDYYSVYHGGRAKHAAFVGQSRRLLEDEEAFERACDEVGIYTVVAVDLDIVDIPGGEDRTTAGGGAAGAGAAGAAAGAGAADAAGAGTESTSGDDAESATDATSASAGAETTDEATLDADIPDAGPDPATGAESGDEPGSPTPRDTGTEAPAREAVTSVDDTTDNDGTDVAGAGVGVADTGRGETDAADTAPSPADGPADDDDIEAAVTSVEQTPPGSATMSATDEPVDEQPGEESSPETGSKPDTGAEDAAALRSTLAARETEVEQLEDEVARLESELQSVRDERDDLAARVENLEGRLRDLGSGSAAPETSMTAEAALSGTSLFVRYRSKSEPTLDDLQEGVSREGVVGNLRLEHHTEFDDETVAVDGRAFDAFLEDTQEYRFARWLVTDLPLEIRDTRNQQKLADLYGALPDIDRIEFAATVADGTFDLVARDRMGEPLVVATLDDSREPTRDEAMADLVRGGSAVSEESGSLAGAMAVTKAFFEPEALATAEEATGGSLLSRDKRESYVKLSRGRGFHLCLVEDRDESFYLSIPEL